MKLGICIDPHLQERNPSRYRRDDYLEAILGKISYICENNDKVIIGGDLLNHPNNSVYFFNRVCEVLSAYRGKIILIPGNHDLFNRSYVDLDKSTLKSLEYADIVDIKTETFYLDKLMIGVSLVGKDITKIPIDTNNNSILIGHNYFEYSSTPEESLTSEDIRELNYNLVFLGHDHSPYEESFIGNSTLIRMGSLCRKTVDKYNENRGIYYYQIDTETLDYEKLEVPSKPSHEVFTEGAFTELKVNNILGIEKFTEVIRKLTKSASGKVSLLAKLKQLEVPKKNIDIIKHIHEENGETFN